MTENEKQQESESEEKARAVARKMAVKKKFVVMQAKGLTLNPEDVTVNTVGSRAPASALLGGRVARRSSPIVVADADPTDGVVWFDFDPTDGITRADVDPTDTIVTEPL
jgi:hypothetical protein